MRTPTEQEDLTQYCDRCEDRGCTAIVICDNCPATCCVHLSGRVDGQLWCARCIGRAGMNQDILSRWFWAGGWE